MTYTVGQDAGKGGGDTADEVEYRVSLANLI
jgi:hypothetical protein